MSVRLTTDEHCYAILAAAVDHESWGPTLADELVAAVPPDQRSDVIEALAGISSALVVKLAGLAHEPPERLLRAMFDAWGEL